MHCQRIVSWGAPLEAHDCPTPAPQGAEVLLRVEAAGVCHSDVHIRAGYFDLGDGERATLEERGAMLPLTLGHETVGEVVALGSDARGAAVGDKRVVFPWIGCDDCDWCESGREHLCNAAKFIGARVDGGYADHVLVPHSRYLIDYGDVPTDLACTYACSGITAYGALTKIGEIGAGDSIVIIGAGGVGLNAVHIAQALYGDARIVAADIDANKRQAAQGAGAAHTVDNSRAEAVAEVIELTGGGAAATLDFVGAGTSSKFGVDVLRKAGTHVVVGLYGGSKLPLALPAVPPRQLTLRGSYVGTLPEMHALMDLVHAGKVPPIPTSPRPLAEADAALADLENGRVVGRYVLKP